MSIQDEFSFIKSIQPSSHFHRNLLKGIGDDAAVYLPDGSNQLVCLDTMVEGIHFNEITMCPVDIGWKALAINLSDIAAMGGIPDYYLVSVAIPSHWRNHIHEIYDGMKKCGDTYNVDLIGGDTVSSKTGLMISITVLGHLEKEEKAYYRSDAMPGDRLFVTGTLGDSAAGLEILQMKKVNDVVQPLVKAHQRPEPQITAARLLRKEKGRFAVNDISDGLASEANEIAVASQVGLEIWADRLPISKALLDYTNKDRRMEWVLNGGEDFQLLFTSPPELAKSLQEKFDHHGIPVTEIGRVTENTGEVLLIDQLGKRRLTPTGYNHFTNNEG